MRAATKGEKPEGYVKAPGSSRSRSAIFSAGLIRCLSYPPATEESITATDHLEWLHELTRKSGEPVYTLVRLRNVGVLVGATVLGRFLLRTFRALLF